MGRGRGRMGSFGAATLRRPPAGAPAGPRTELVERELEAIQARVPERCRVEAEAVLGGASNSELPLARTMLRAGGVRGDDKWAASDLWEAACWLEAAGEHARALEVMRQAAAHQDAHTRRLADAAARPRSGRNYGYLQALGKGGLQTARSDATRLTGRIAAFIDDPGAREEEGAFRRWLALGELVAGPLRRLLDEGRLAEAKALALGVHAAGDDQKGIEGIEAMSEEELSRAARLLRANEILREDEDEGRADRLLSDLPHHGTDWWRAAIAPRLVGDAEEGMLEDASVYGLGRWETVRSSYQGERADLAPIARAEDVLARAAGLLRTPRRYERVAYGGPQPDLRGRLVRVEATPSAFREFCDQQSDNPAFFGYALTTRGDQLELVARMAVRSAGDDIEVRCALPFGRTTRRVLRTQLAQAREHPDWPAELLRDEEVGFVETPDNAPVSRPYSFPRGEGPRHLSTGQLQAGGIDAMLGPDACEHPQGRWVPVGRDGQGARVAAPDGIALECPRCLRRRIAVLPLMSVPRDDPRRPELEWTPDEELLRREHAYRAMRGKPQITDAELRVELTAGTPESLDPTRWATRPPVEDPSRALRARAGRFARR